MPVALGVNGGVLGSNNLPTATTFRGIFTPNEVARAIALGFWPINKSQAVTGVAGSGALGTLTVGSNADPYFNLTTLLLSTTATNGQQNNTFQDSSTNNFTITRNPATGPNAPTQGTFSPFSQTGWGNYFSGSYLTVPASADFNLGTNDFCIEFWLNAISPANYGGILSFDSGGDYPVNFSYASAAGSNLQANFGSASAWYFSANFDTSTATNQWDHYVATRSGSTFRIFKNGVLKATGTNSGSIGASSGTVNINANGAIAGTTYLSNLRIINGSIPTSYQTSSTTVGTTIFTVPTSPLTTTSQGATAADVKLLTCQSNRFVDSSTSSPKTITLSGSPQVVAFSPFNPTASWSAATYGGSGYFDGNGDYLTVPTTTSLSFGTGDFTIEAWIYRTGNNGGEDWTIIDGRASNSATPWVFGMTSARVPYFYDGVSQRNSSVTVDPFAWTHIAVTRLSGTLKIFVNGVAGYSASNSTNLDRTAGAVVGSSIGLTSGLAVGYISNLRVLKGTGYSSISVPTAPLTAITNTQLLLNFTNAGIYDATSKNVLETVGDAQISNTTAKWGSTSIKFDGTGDYLQAPYQTLSADFGTGQFTIELWVYFSSSVSTTQMFVSSNYNAATGAGGWAFLRRGDNNTIVFTQGANVAYGKTWSPSLNTWYHCAVTRDSSNNLRIFVDGTQVGSTDASVTASINGATSLLIGTNQIGPFPLTGYIQDLRVTRGYARYTANFTPPTSAFPTL